MTDAFDGFAVLLVDDHPVVRKGTRELLEGEPDLRVVGEAGSGEEALTQARALTPEPSARTRLPEMPSFMTPSWSGAGWARTRSASTRG